ncbi:PRC and DUF2382 domain-containing protein [Actinoplanes philippinensis]|uniref:PRC and DUF2382 domain-containing protein n=1 Tax=Actinoplanes philippinensis TaxID=35752 RepID=UPI0033FFC1BE
MIAQEQIGSLYGLDVHDRTGDKVGSIGAVWSDGAGRPAWASVKTGWFGLNESLVPLQDATVQGDTVTLPYEKAQIKEAPNIDAERDEPLTEDEVDRLYQYYGTSWQDSYRAYQTGAAATDASFTGTRAGAGHGATDRRGADDAMTRSEERLNVDTETEQVGRARLRKYVVTEQEQVTVPVTREEVRLDREPITAANRDAAYSGQDITESEYDVTLHAERPVVQTETVPVERVRLGKETVTEQQTVGGEVRKEHIEADLPDERGRRTIG